MRLQRVQGTKGKPKDLSISQLEYVVGEGAIRGRITEVRRAHDLATCRRIISILFQQAAERGLRVVPFMRRVNNQ